MGEWFGDNGNYTMEMKFMRLEAICHFRCDFL